MMRTLTPLTTAAVRLCACPNGNPKCNPHHQGWGNRKGALFAKVVVNNDYHNNQFQQVSYPTLSFQLAEL